MFVILTPAILNIMFLIKATKLRFRELRPDFHEKIIFPSPIHFKKISGWDATRIYRLENFTFNWEKRFELIQLFRWDRARTFLLSNANVRREKKIWRFSGTFRKIFVCLWDDRCARRRFGKRNVLDPSSWFCFRDFPSGKVVSRRDECKKRGKFLCDD